MKDLWRVSGHRVWARKVPGSSFFIDRIADGSNGIGRVIRYETAPGPARKPDNGRDLQHLLARAALGLPACISRVGRAGGCASDGAPLRPIDGTDCDIQEVMIMALSSEYPTIRAARKLGAHGDEPGGSGHQPPAPVHLPFRDRHEAGRVLAAEIRRRGYSPGRIDQIVLALPRGGVPVAYEIARALDAPLDVFLVRKLGLPEQPELAMGAIASGGVRVLNPEVVGALRIPRHIIDAVADDEQVEMERREREYRDGREPADLNNKIVFVVDDGLATGSTMRAAATALRLLNPKKIVLVAPVGAAETVDALRSVADDIIVAAIPDPFRAVGLWYEDFSQTTDEEVRELLQRAYREQPPGAYPEAPSTKHQ
jgi:predicted phosphoribosyltransferase